LSVWFPEPGPRLTASMWYGYKTNSSLSDGYLRVTALAVAPAFFFPADFFAADFFAADFFAPPRDLAVACARRAPALTFASASSSGS